MKKNMRKCPECGRIASTTAVSWEAPGPEDRYVAHGPGPDGQIVCPGSGCIVVKK